MNLYITKLICSTKCSQGKKSLNQYRGTLVYVRFGIKPALYTSYSDAQKCLEYNSRTRTCMSQRSPNFACCSCLPLGRQRYIEIKFSPILSNCFCNYCILWHMMPFSRQKMAKKITLHLVCYCEASFTWTTKNLHHCIIQARVLYNFFTHNIRKCRK